VETFDTNVLVRLVVQDDADQCARAERSWRSAVGSSGVFLPVVALAELTWVLRVAYKLDRKMTEKANQPGKTPKFHSCVIL